VLDASAAEVVDKLDQGPADPAEPVQGGDDQDLTLAELVDQGVEHGPAGSAAAGLGAYDVDAGAVQLLDLAGDVLGSGADAGVSVGSHALSVPETSPTGSAARPVKRGVLNGYRSGVSPHRRGRSPSTDFERGRGLVSGAVGEITRFRNPRPGSGGIVRP